MVQKFIAKPTEVKAVQWTGDNIEETKSLTRLYYIWYGDTLAIRNVLLRPGDWIVFCSENEPAFLTQERFNDLFAPVVDSQTVTIPKAKYGELQKDRLKLSYLEAHGVGNWEGYDDAMGELRQIEDSWEV